MKGGDSSPRTPPRLWLALAAGPLAWFVHLGASYALAALDCGGGPVAMLHLATALALALQAAGVAVAWRLRPGFLPIAALALNVFFAAVVVVAGTSPLALPGCDRAAALA